MNRFPPWIIVVVCAAWVGSRAMPPKDPDGEMKIHGFGRLPVVYQGRIKPYDSFAKNTLRLLSGKSTFTDEEGEKQPAIRWLLNVVTDSPRARKHRVVRIVNLNLLETLGLQRRKGFRYSIEEIQLGFRDGMDAVKAAQAKRESKKPLDAYESAAIKFSNKLRIWSLIQESHALFQPGSMEEFNRAKQRIEVLTPFTLPHVVPPRMPEDEWSPLMEAYSS